MTEVMYKYLGRVYLCLLFFIIMCWKTNYSPVRNIAQKDIVSYKILRKDGRAYYREFWYEIGKLYCLNEPLKLKFEYVINKGFHSYSEEANLYTDLYNIFLFAGRSYNSATYSAKNSILVRCIIPKGSEYYINERGEIVSNQIIIDNYVLVIIPSDKESS